MEISRNVAVVDGDLACSVQEVRLPFGRDATRYIPVHRVALSPQCLSSGAGHIQLSEDAQWRH